MQNIRFCLFPAKFTHTPKHGIFVRQADKTLAHTSMKRLV